MIVVTISGKPIDRNPKPTKTKVIWPAHAEIPSPEEKPIQEISGEAVPPSKGGGSAMGGAGGLKRVEDSLWQEINAIKAERERLSSSIAPLVFRFQQEGKIVGTQILDPQARDHLSQLYDQIETLTKEASAVYRKIHDAETPKPLGDSASLREPGNTQQLSSAEASTQADLKLLKRSIQNRRHKLKKKIELAEAKAKVKPERASGKLQQWILQLASLDAEEQSINEKLLNS